MDERGVGGTRREGSSLCCSPAQSYSPVGVKREGARASLRGEGAGAGETHKLYSQLLPPPCASAQRASAVLYLRGLPRLLEGAWRMVEGLGIAPCRPKDN